MPQYIERNRQVEQVWKVEYSNRYFQQVIFIRGTESEMHKYVESEFGFVGKYSACTSQEIDAIDTLNLKIYIAPKN